MTAIYEKSPLNKRRPSPDGYVNLTIPEEDTRIDIRNLLMDDCDLIADNELKNVILVSVLYHDLSDEIEFNNLVTYHSSQISSGEFKDQIIVSIQKETFQAIATFLRSEAGL